MVNVGDPGRIYFWRHPEQRIYEFEFVDLANYDRCTERYESLRLKDDLNALGKQGYKIIHYEDSTGQVWLQRER